MANIAGEAGDPCLGLHWAEAYPKGGSGVVGYLALNAPTVRDAAKSIARYASFLVDPVDGSFEEVGLTGKLEWRFSPKFTAPRVQYASFAMALTLMRLRKSLGTIWLPLEVQLEHRELPCKESVARVLGPSVRFDCATNAIVISKEVLDRVNPNADQRLFDIMRQWGDYLLEERRSKADIAESTRRAVVRQLEHGDATLETVAKSMQMSARVLQSRLTAAGTNFESVLIDSRQNLADHYLRDTDLPLTEIAFRLGFSELSAFTRAATRWFGMPPSDRRSGLRGKAGGTS